MYPFDNHFLSPIASPANVDVFSDSTSSSSHIPEEADSLCLSPQQLHLFDTDCLEERFVEPHTSSVSPTALNSLHFFDITQTMTGSTTRSSSINSVMTPQQILSYNPQTLPSSLYPSNINTTSPAHARIHHSRDVASYQQLSQRIRELLPSAPRKVSDAQPISSTLELALTTCRTPSSDALMAQLEQDLQNLLGSDDAHQPVKDLSTLSSATLNKIWSRGNNHYLTFLQSIAEAEPMLFRTQKRSRSSRLEISTLPVTYTSKSLLFRTGRQFKGSKIYRYLTKRNVIRLQPVAALAAICLQRQDHTNLTRILAVYPEIIDTLLLHQNIFSDRSIFHDANIWSLLAQSVAVMHLHPEASQRYLPHLSAALVAYFEDQAQLAQDPTAHALQAHPFSDMLQFCTNPPSQKILRFQQNLGRFWLHLFPSNVPIFDLLLHTRYRENIDRIACVYLICILSRACDTYLLHLHETGLKSALRMFFQMALPSMLREGLFVFGQKSLTSSQMQVLLPTADGLPQNAEDAAAFRDELIQTYASLKLKDFFQMRQDVALRRQEAGQRASKLLCTMYEQYHTDQNVPGVSGS